MAPRCVRLPDALEGQVANVVRIDGHLSIAALFRVAPVCRRTTSRARSRGNPRAAKAQAKERHQKLLRMASVIMKGEAQVAMSELAADEEIRPRNRNDT
jgi:hypothetical protein